MRAKSERLKVEVTEASTENIRTFTITLKASVSEFQLTDLLRQRGVISALDTELKQAIKNATDAYLKSAEMLITNLATNSSSKRKSRLNSNGNKSLGEDFC